MDEMDCMRAQELLSAALDGQASAEEVAEARRHAASCAACSRFASGLERLASAEGTKAPDRLVDRVILAVRAEAQRDAAPEPQPEAPPVPLAALEPAAELPRRTAGWWAPRVAAGVGIAAALVIAIGTMSSFFAPKGGVEGVPVRTSKSAPQAESDGQNRYGADGGDLGSAPGEAVTGNRDSAAGPGPRLVTSGSFVYYSAGPLEPVPSAAAGGDGVTTGTVLTSLDSGEAATNRRTWSDADRPGILFVEMTNGQVEPFARATRVLQGRTYALVSGQPVTSFGLWPALPRGMEQPVKPTGWPSFVYSGLTDDYGAKVYVRNGATAAEGYAVEPEAAGPIGSVPVWTWWKPLP